MKIFKRVAACALAAGMVVSLAACGGNTEENGTNTTHNPFIFGDYTGNVNPEDDGGGSAGSNSPGSDEPGSPDMQKADVTEAEDTISITFPEGYTLAKMILTLVDKGMGSEEAFWAVVNDSSVTSACSYIAQEPDRGARAFRMEGYLWPSTYEFYKDATPAEIFTKMLSTTESKYASYASRASAVGLNLDEAITLASIVEKEASNSSDMKNVASVLLNRLEAGKQLECDSTITYVEGALLGYHTKAGISGNGDQFRPTYNTYKCFGIPAGPICNPSSTAIEAVLNAPDTDYLYFVSKDGKCYFSATYKEHQAKCKELGVEPIMD